MYENNGGNEIYPHSSYEDHAEPSSNSNSGTEGGMDIHRVQNLNAQSVLLTKSGHLMTKNVIEDPTLQLDSIYMTP